MPTFVVLLRGINVGGKNLIPMERLRAVCESAGFRDVRTYIQSGNLVLAGPGTAPAVEAPLEAGIARALGLEIPVVARTAARWAAYLESPFEEAASREPNRVLLGLSKARPVRGAAASLQERAAAGERVAVVGDAVWIHYPRGAGTSKLTPALIDRLVGSPTTARNLNTVRELAELAGARPAPPRGPPG